MVGRGEGGRVAAKEVGGSEGGPNGSQTLSANPFRASACVSLRQYTAQIFAHVRPVRPVRRWAQRCLMRSGLNYTHIGLATPVTSMTMVPEWLRQSE